MQAVVFLPVTGERADLGVGRYPRLPFGTRGMLVTSPAPRSAWVPRAEPCTIFGSCNDISDAQWVYQKGWINARTDLQPQGMAHDDLIWVQLNAKNWDAPDCPLDLPMLQTMTLQQSHNFDPVTFLQLPNNLRPAKLASRRVLAAVEQGHTAWWGGVPTSTSSNSRRSHSS